MQYDVCGWGLFTFSGWGLFTFSYPVKSLLYENKGPLSNAEPKTPFGFISPRLPVHLKLPFQVNLTRC
jgi:hypothetical protein